MFISTCAVHDQILDDRLLDESAPAVVADPLRCAQGRHRTVRAQLWVRCRFSDLRLRQTGIYGIDRPATRSRWYRLVNNVVQGRAVECRRGGKEVHVSDVAKAAPLLLRVPGVAGEVFNCYDRYVSEYEVAQLAAQCAGATRCVSGERTRPKHEIQTGKIRQLGLEFGGEPLLRQTISDMVQLIQPS